MRAYTVAGHNNVEREPQTSGESQLKGRIVCFPVCASVPRYIIFPNHGVAENQVPTPDLWLGVRGPSGNGRGISLFWSPLLSCPGCVRGVGSWWGHWIQGMGIKSPLWLPFWSNPTFYACLVCSWTPRFISALRTESVSFPLPAFVSRQNLLACIHLQQASSLFLRELVPRLPSSGLPRP
jgi:hypothetical protein